MMISKVVGAGRTAVVAGFLSLSMVTAAHAADQCQDVFKTTKSEATDKNDPKARFTIDAKTKQARMESFVKIADDQELYVDFLKPAPGKPIIVLLNGLTYRVGVWDAFVDNLKGDGLGILRYDPIGMGETMKKYGPPKGPVEIKDQVADLNKLLKALGITQKVHLLGLSYGGGVAIEFAGTYPNKVATLMPEAAFTEPLKEQVDQINTLIAMTRVSFPFNPATDAQLYSYFLRNIVYSTYPISEPIVLEHPYKLESVYRLAEGTKTFRGVDWISKLPKGSVHQIDAGKDQYITADVPQRFWDALPAAVRGSRMILDHSEHKIPEAMPHISAEWVKLIINRDPRIQSGETWTGGVWAGGFSAGPTKIVIN